MDEDKKKKIKRKICTFNALSLTLRLKTGSPLVEEVFENELYGVFGGTENGKLLNSVVET